MSTPWAPDARASETACHCSPCREKRGEANPLRAGTIYEYSHKPDWRPRRAGASDTFPYFMGVELETTVPDDDEAIRNEMAVDLRRPKSLWFAKHDSSVSGPEFVSHPATLPYWQAHQPEVGEMLRLLVHAGFRSHNGAEAGMHVNIGREAFEGSDHLHRLCVLLYSNMAWATVLSQRSDYQISQWCGFAAVSPSLAFEFLRWGGGNKHGYINAPGDGRIEFRMPRGTLRIDRFYKNMEWAAAMVAFARTRYRLLPGDFDAFVRRHHATYSNLVAFLDEKADAVRTAAANDRYARGPRLFDCGYDEEDDLICA